MSRLRHRAQSSTVHCLGRPLVSGRREPSDAQCGSCYWRSRMGRTAPSSAADFGRRAHECTPLTASGATDPLFPAGFATVIWDSTVPVRPAVSGSGRQPIPTGCQRVRRRQGTKDATPAERNDRSTTMCTSLRAATTHTTKPQHSGRPGWNFLCQQNCAVPNYLAQEKQLCPDEQNNG